MNINHIMQRVSEIMGVSVQDIKTKSTLESVRCKAMIVELCGNRVGVREIARYLNIDHSTVTHYRQGNMWDKWEIKDQIELMRVKTEMVSEIINFTYPGEYTYHIVK